MLHPRKSAQRGFTLVELLIVIGIIGILAGLMIGVAPLIMDKGKRSRAAAEIAAFETALQNYKEDNGSYPFNNIIVPGSTPVAFPNPVTPPAIPAVLTDLTYIAGATVLFQNLSGQETFAAALYVYPGPPTKTATVYLAFKKNMVDPTGTWACDPWKNPYGYSWAQSVYPSGMLYDGQPPPGTGPHSISYNTDSFDLWSTAGTVSAAGAASNPQKKWVTNWPNVPN